MMTRMTRPYSVVMCSFMNTHKRLDMRMRRVIFFSPNEQRAGGEGGGALPVFFFFFPCSADHERDWPPYQVVFFGLATNTLNVRKNNTFRECIPFVAFDRSFRHNYHLFYPPLGISMRVA